MPNFKLLPKICLSLPEAAEAPHFEKTSFRVKGKIFATYDAKANRSTLKLHADDQNRYSSSSNGKVYPVDKAWGKQGWTLVEISSLKKEMLEAIVKSAYCQVAPKTLAAFVTKTKL